MSKKNEPENINKFTDLVTGNTKPFISYDQLPCDHNELLIELTATMLFLKWEIDKNQDPLKKDELSNKYKWLKHLYFAQSLVLEKAGADFLNSFWNKMNTRNIEELDEEDFQTVEKMMQLIKENLIDYKQRYISLEQQKKI